MLCLFHSTLLLAEKRLATVFLSRLCQRDYLSESMKRWNTEALSKKNKEDRKLFHIVLVPGFI